MKIKKWPNHFGLRIWLKWYSYAVLIDKNFRILFIPKCKYIQIGWLYVEWFKMENK